MAVALVQDFQEPEGDRSTPNYDAISKRLADQGDPPDGLLVHTAGFTGHGFRIFEVWESKEQFERFFNDRLMPLIVEVGAADGPPPQQTIYELHNVVLP